MVGVLLTPCAAPIDCSIEFNCSSVSAIVLAPPIPDDVPPIALFFLIKSTGGLFLLPEDSLFPNVFPDPFNVSLFLLADAAFSLVTSLGLLSSLLPDESLP